ncbi:hypothetical protein DBV15_02955 [Temnothorax longispinosus]|uniref:Uncharacterized protein n=1 Tax=Temnothorax longispinosus TaxID=300112 RepID=A0A4S2JP87_9HYME|nr:hypothetical protein DBV15_02955 [Temnothorax longispinosus]
MARLVGRRSILAFLPDVVIVIVVIAIFIYISDLPIGSRSAGGSYKPPPTDFTPESLRRVAPKHAGDDGEYPIPLAISLRLAAGATSPSVFKTRRGGRQGPIITGDWKVLHRRGNVSLTLTKVGKCKPITHDDRGLLHIPRGHTCVVASRLPILFLSLGSFDIFYSLLGKKAMSVDFY